MAARLQAIDAEVSHALVKATRRNFVGVSLAKIFARFLGNCWLITNGKAGFFVALVAVKYPVVLLVCIASVVSCKRVAQEHTDAPGAASQVALVPKAGATSASRPAERSSVNLLKASTLVSEPRTPQALALTPDAQRRFETAHVAFTLAAYSKLATPNENLVFSPLNIQLAMGMALSSAQGQERTNLAQALAPSVDAGAVERALRSWGASLLKPNQTKRPAADQVEARLRLANAIWVDSGIGVSPTFLQRVNETYGPALYRAPFVDDAPAVIADINNWVSERTFGRIPRLIDSLSGKTLAMFVSAAYLKAQFLPRFSTTYKDSFFPQPDRDVRVEFLETTRMLYVVRSNEYQAFELPINYGNLAVVSIMPKALPIATFMNKLTATKWKAIRTSLRGTTKRTTLSWPKFDIRSRFADLMKRLSLPSVNLASAFTGQNVDIGNVIHEATIATNQDGLEAAAATAVEAVPISWNGTTLEPPIVVKFNRPFLFAVVDTTTGAILFLGQFTGA